MDTDRISIARLLALGLPFTWQEAVAVCRAAAMANDVDSAMNDRPPLVTPDACFITREGEVEFPETADHESPEAMTLLLREMLDGREAPEAIRAVAFSRGSLDLLAALAEFPVANPRAQIAALAARALNQRASADHMPRLAASAPAAPAAPTPTPTPTPTSAATPPTTASKPYPPVAAPRPRVDERAHTTAPPRRAEGPERATAEELLSLRRRSAASPAARAMFVNRLRQTATSFRSATTLLAVVALVALVSMAWWLARGAGPTVVEARPVSASPLLSVALPRFAAPVVPHPPDTRRAALSQGITSAPPALVEAGATPVGVAGRQEVPSPLPAPSDTSAGTASGNAPSTGEPALALVPPAPPAMPPEPVARTPIDAPAAPPTTTVEPANDDATVFSAEDLDVVPPRLRRQQLPVAVREPGVEVPEGWSYLVLVVDPEGAVETVRLTGRTPAPGLSLYRHRMLVAAAKAWQFAPAKKNGKPVRYAIRVALEP